MVAKGSLFKLFDHQTVLGEHLFLLAFIQTHPWPQFCRQVILEPCVLITYFPWQVVQLSVLNINTGRQTLGHDCFAVHKEQTLLLELKNWGTSWQKPEKQVLDGVLKSPHNIFVNPTKSA